MTVRNVMFALVALGAGIAGADPTIQEDGAFGIELVADHPLLGDGKGMAAALAKCVATTPGGGSPLFWAEISAKGVVTSAKVHGSAKPALDACAATALRKGAVKDKLSRGFTLVGRIDLGGEAARVNDTPVMLNPHDAMWQVTVAKVGYTANRAADIAQSLDGVSEAIAKCAPKRVARTTTEFAVAWRAKGVAVVKSGVPGYDACVGKALGKVALPVAESGMWLVLSFSKPAEPLAARTDKASLSKAQALKDAMTTAVRSRAAQLVTCLDGKPKANLVKVTVALKATKLSVSKVATGDAAADTCVKKKLDGVVIPNAEAKDTAEHEISIEKE